MEYPAFHVSQGGVNKGEGLPDVALVVDDENGDGSVRRHRSGHRPLSRYTPSTPTIENTPSSQLIVANWSQTTNGKCCMQLEPAIHEYVQARPVGQ